MATNNLQRDQLHKTIWEIANSLRGAIDGWEFKSYVLGTIFYRFVSENMQQYIKHLQELAGVPNFDYSKMEDRTAEVIREQMVTEKGYFILPSQLFCNVCANCEHDDNLNITLQKIFRSIEASAQGTESEEDVKGLFSDFAVDNTQLGSSVAARNRLLAKVLLAVKNMDLKSSSFEDNSIDTFGDAYEFLMQMYASEAGKSGGEFFTPQEVSELLAMIVSFNNNVKNVYDPACGSGSLLLKIAKINGKKENDLKYFGQEINPTTYNLCRINMFLHNINFSDFDIKLGDTLHYPQHLTFKGKFDAIVSNPPYSLRWDGKDNPILIGDDRYNPAGILAPKSAADLAFTMHMLYHLSETGTCAIVEFPGVLYRGGAEQKIREYLIKNNFVDAVINLPANLFFGVGIQTCIIVLKKNKKDSDILFINAENEFQKVGNKNKLMPEHQTKIFEAYTKRENELYFCKLAKRSDVEAKDYNLSVSTYVEQEDKREVINIEEVNANLEDIVKKGQALRQTVNQIIAEL